MSSPTDNPARIPAGRLRHAARRAGASRYMGCVAGAVALALVGVFAYQAGLYAYLMPAEAPPVPRIEDPGQITSYKSTLTGKDSKDQPYEIVATRSWQDKDMAHVFHLEQLQATLRRPTGNPLRLTGNSARYDSRARVADVEGAVSIVQEGRFTARMEKVRINMADSSLSTGAPVKVDMAQGTIAANAMEITGDGANILFLNGVKAHFETSAAAQGTSP